MIYHNFKSRSGDVVVVIVVVVMFATTYAGSAYHLWGCEFESNSWRGVLDTTLGDKVCQW